MRPTRINTCSFRAATNADVPAMVQCRENDWEAGPADERMIAYFEGQHHPQQALPERAGYVALLGQQVIGYIAGHRTTRHNCEGELQYLYVARAYRRRGIGSALLQRLAHWFATQEARRICVAIANDSPPQARPFVKRLGAVQLNEHWYVWEDLAAAAVKDTDRQVALVRELLFHVNDVFHQRVNLLLVAESIFFAAIATLWRDADLLIKIIICSLGFVITLVLLFANLTLYKRSNLLTSKLAAIDSIYTDYLNAFPRFVSVTGLLSHFVPIVCLIAWIVVILRIVRVI